MSVNVLQQVLNHGYGWNTHAMIAAGSKRKEARKLKRKKKLAKLAPLIYAAGIQHELSQIIVEYAVPNNSYEGLPGMDTDSKDD